MIFLKFPFSIFILLSCFFAPAKPVDPAKQAELNRTLIKAVRNYSSSSSRGPGKGEESGTMENIERLFAEGADPNARMEDGRTFFVSYNLYPHLVEMFLEAGADPNLTVSEEDRRTKLHLTRHPAVVRMLLEKGADPNAQDEDDYSPLHEQRDHEIIRALLEWGADPNLQNSSGNTPLHELPADEKGIVSARYLISYGADPKLENHRGEIPFIVKTTPLTFEQQTETSCKYITESSQIKVTQCGRRNVCMTETLCTFEIGIAPNTTKIEKVFPIVCSSLSNGQCPEANDCVLDRSVTEAEQPQAETPSSSSSEPTKATR